MTVPKSATKTTSSGDDVKTAADAQKPKVRDQVSVRGGKEFDTGRSEEEKLMGEVVRESRDADIEAENKLRQEIGEARHAKPRVELPPDVADSGVKSPENEASEVVASGSTIVLPVSEEEYKKGEFIAVSGKSVSKEIVGVFSISGLVMLVGRIIKMAHKHAKRVIFRKGDE